MFYSTTRSLVNYLVQNCLTVNYGFIALYKMAVHQITPVEGDLLDLLNNSFGKRFRRGFIKVDGCILPQNYLEYADAIENFEIRDDDVWVCGFPKTGTTWVQEMVWSIANDLDFERGKVSINERFPGLERSVTWDRSILLASKPEGIKSEDFFPDSTIVAAKLPSPRFIKSHLPHNLLPRQLRNGEKNAKVIYICRNAKDTCISFYHYAKLVLGYEGSSDDFYELFLGGAVVRAPFWKHLLDFWNKRNDSNMLFLKYEDMIKELPSVIKETGIFLGKNLTNDQISLLTEHLSFAKMKENPSVNHRKKMPWIQKTFQLKQGGEFFRSGTSGQWETVMKPGVIKKFDDWTDEHLNGTGLSF